MIRTRHGPSPIRPAASAKCCYSRRGVGCHDAAFCCPYPRQAAPTQQPAYNPAELSGPHISPAPGSPGSPTSTRRPDSNPNRRSRASVIPAADALAAICDTSFRHHDQAPQGGPVAFLPFPQLSRQRHSPRHDPNADRTEPHLAPAKFSFTESCADPHCRPIVRTLPSCRVKTVPRPCSRSGIGPLICALAPRSDQRADARHVPPQSKVDV